MAFPDEPTRGAGDPAQLAAILKRDANRGTVTVEQGSEPDELYMMTGAAEGITVKVLRIGR